MSSVCFYFEVHQPYRLKPYGALQVGRDHEYFDDRLNAEELVRYRSANRYAGKYCMKLAPRLATSPGPDALREELCYFYRLAQPGKIEHIESA